MDETIPLVDGLRLTEPADDAGSGEVWRARVTGGLGGQRGDPLPGELPGVGECLVRLLRLPVDDALRSRAHAVASDLLTLDDPGLLGIRAVRSAFDGVALVLAPVPYPVLPLHLLARRRQLSAGEVVTLGVALAWALGAALGVGVTHGRLRDADVLLAADGRPLLTGVGVMGVLGAAGEPIDDVRALERLLASLLDLESAKAPRVGAALAGRAVAAGELAARLAEAAPATVIRVDDAPAADGPVEVVPQPPARRPARRRLRRGGLVVLSGLAIVLLAGVVGWVSAPSPQAGSPGGRVPAVGSGAGGLDRCADPARCRPGGGLRAPGHCLPGGGRRAIHPGLPL